MTRASAINHEARSLDRYFPADCFLAPRLMEESARWFSGTAQRIECMTANNLACMGEMTVICHRGTLSPAGLAAMTAAGAPPAMRRLEYVTRQDYMERIKELVERGQRAVAPYWGAPGIRPDAAYVDPAVLQLLNSKANMTAFVPRENLPKRRAISAVELGDPRLRHELSRSVLKVAASLPVGGGVGVRMPEGRFRARKTMKAMREADAVIVEERLDIRENYCVQFAVSAEASVLYIGSTSQICLPGGAHVGNLLDPDSAPPAGVVTLGHEIARRGAERGFRGLAGFDIVVCGDGRVLAIDLNFRLVSSTGQVLLHPALSRERGLAISRLAFASFAGDLAQMLKAIDRCVAAGWLVPIATFDPDFGCMGKGPSRARLLIFGTSASDIGEREVELEYLGLVLAGRKASLRTRLLRLFDRGRV